MSVADRRVVVLGGTSGIGFAVAAMAHAAGAQVVVASRDAGRVADAVARLPGAAGDTIDLRDEASVAGFFERLGPFDHLAATAGDWVAGLFSPLAGLDLAGARDAFEVRFWGVLRVVQIAARTISPAGSVTLTGGMLTQRPRKGTLLATAVGGAVEVLARGLAMDLAPVRVNAVCPGLILTEHVAGRPEEGRRAATAGLPIPRPGSPEEAAMAYLYLMGNGYVTGQVLPVDGGGSLV